MISVSNLICLQGGTHHMISRRTGRLDGYENVCHKCGQTEKEIREAAEAIIPADTSLLQDIMLSVLWQITGVQGLTGPDRDGLFEDTWNHQNQGDPTEADGATYTQQLDELIEMDYVSEGKDGLELTLLAKQDPSWQGPL